MMKKDGNKTKFYIIDFGISKKWYGERYVKGDKNQYYILNKLNSGEEHLYINQLVLKELILK